MKNMDGKFDSKIESFLSTTLQGINKKQTKVLTALKGIIEKLNTLMRID